MPLIKSKSPRAFSKNVATEMHSGKPQPQAVAIAYATQRRARGEKGIHGHMSDTVAKHPSNSSTTGAEHHSGYVQAQSEHYHKNTVSPTYTRPAATLMTRAEHQQNNAEDMSEKGHKL